MRTIADINKEIQAERKRAAEKVAELQERQKENRKHLEQVNEQYLLALAGAGDDTEIAILQEQVEAAERTIKLTDDTIKALVQGNPRIAQLEAERVALLLELMKDAEQKAGEVHEVLKQHHEALIKGVEELNGLYHSWYKAVHSVNGILTNLSSEQKNKLGLPIRVTEQNPIVGIINSLLIERSQGFRR